MMVMGSLIIYVSQKGEQNVKAKEVLEEEAKVFEDLRRQVKVANDR